MGSLPLPTQTLTPDDIPPGPLSEDDLRQRWNREADKYNQWESLDSCEQLAWAQALAIRADRHAAALKPKPAEQRPTDEDLYDLAAEFNGDPVPAMRGALELWGNPLQGAPATGENPAAAPAPVPETPAEALAARPLLERVAKLGDVIGRQTVAQVQELAAQAAEWLRENPPGQPVAIDPRACPTPGACSCVEPTPPAPEAEFDDQQREAVYQAVAEALGSGAYDCTRVWSAWSCGTMGSDDFVPVAEDSDRVAEIADAAIEAIRAIPRARPACPATLLQQQEAELATLKDDGWAKAMTNLVDQIGGDGPSLWEWGASIPTPKKVVEYLREHIDYLEYLGRVQGALTALKVDPVAESERPWEREGWCNKKGDFWAEGINREGIAEWKQANRNYLGNWMVRCLPHNAIPAPYVGDVEA